MNKRYGNNKYIDRNGYFRFKGTNKKVHIWAAEKKLGRKLKTGEVVHHINRDKLDNRPSNLWVFKNQSLHFYIHKKDKKNTGKW